MADLILKNSESLQVLEDEAQDRPTLDLESSSAPRKRRATGPRTKQGRKRSSRNAITHGIFSSVVVLPGEPEKLYKKLLRGLFQAIQPVGELEMFLVEKLAIDAWRLRRLYNVERAEIRLSTEFYACDREAQQAREIRDVEAGLTGALSLVGKGGGLLALEQNPAALRRCLDLLSELQREIEEHGFDTERDIELLAKMYGGAFRNCKGLSVSYREWSATSALPEAERACNKYATPRQCVEGFLSDVEKERSRLTTIQAGLTRTEQDRLSLEVTTRVIPRPERAELLLKYKSSIERDFERTLSQLERVQRQRLGQPQTPRIDVTIATERS